MAPFKSSLARSAGKLLDVSRERDKSLRGAVQSSRYISVGLPYEIGDFVEGGYCGGYISHTANGVATHALIVAPAATGASGPGYTLTTTYAWKNANDGSTSGTSSLYDGKANFDAIVTAGITNHPAANFCYTRNINGYTDWYLPAILEYDIAYQNLKPTTASNNTSSGVNAYAVPPRGSNRTSGDPSQTSVALFQSGGAQAFVEQTTTGHWSSTYASSNRAYRMQFYTGYNDPTASNSFVNPFPVRAFRRVAV